MSQTIQVEKSKQKKARMHERQTWIKKIYKLEPHSAYRAWQRLYYHDMEKLLPGLRGKQKGEWIFVLLMILGAGFGGAVTGLFVSQNTVNHPLQLIGVCNSPGATLVLDNNHNPVDCVTSTLKTITGQNGAVTVKNITVPSGTVYYPNGTRWP